MSEVAGAAAATLRTLGSVLWRIVLFFCVWAILLGAILVPLSGRIQTWQTIAPLRFRLGVDAVTLATILLASWIMARLVDRRAPARVGLGRVRAAPDLVLGFIAGVVWLGLSLAIGAAGGWVAPEPRAHVSGSVLLAMTISTALNVLAQQLLLCGYVFAVLLKWTSFRASLLVSSSLFAGYHAGAFHGAAWLPALNLFAAGALFCLARQRTGRIWLGSGIHFAWNLLLGPVLGLTVSGDPGFGSGWHLLRLRGPALVCGGAFGLEGGLIVTLTTAAAIAALALVSHTRAREGGAARADPGVVDAGPPSAL
ncbi:MAG TPA: type II CAAX endopeptidase family protein [Terriglobales bacterium]|nr:type II CAAX endopeptidase family protein [Terriglobales bacterium]